MGRPGRADPFSRFVRTARAFGTDVRAATAVEFALISLPFFALLFAIVQVAMVLFISSAMQTAVTDAGRPIWARETDDAAPSFEQVRTAICARVPMFDCEGLRIQLTANANPAAVDPAAFDEDCFDPDQEPDATCYDPGEARDVLVLRATYEWPFGIGLSKLGGRTMLVSTAVFRNEMF
jgi:Flp pilus assembly protein TadG